MDNARRVKLAAIGGFLGSGKTTLMLELGKKLTSQGKTVAMITNDQGEVLVDTNIIKDYGFAVTEVVGGCFCCKFPDFVTHIREMAEEVKPDIILAESVGSCTDLLATVYAPLRKYYKEEFCLSPFTVLIDATTILTFDRDHNLASPRTYTGSLYSWQIREGDILAINKIDLLSKDNLQTIENLLRKINQEAEIIQISAKNDFNLDMLLKKLMNEEHRPRPTITEMIDYNTYASAEAELGWFNGVYKIYSDRPFKVDVLMEEFLRDIDKRITDWGGIVDHAKARFSTKEGTAKISLVRGTVDITGKVPSPSKYADIILNIRAAIDPDVLNNLVKASLNAITSKYNAIYGDWASRSFRPSYPKPYYRFVHT
jgi:G3E family GTPase